VNNEHCGLDNLREVCYFENDGKYSPLQIQFNLIKMQNYSVKDSEEERKVSHRPGETICKIYIHLKKDLNPRHTKNS